MSNKTKLAEELTKRFVEELTKRFVDEGKIIEAGFASLRIMAIPKDAPEVQVREMRMAFMAGAQHLFSSIMSILEPGAEPTEADLRRMDIINAELEAFTRELKLRLAPKG